MGQKWCCFPHWSGKNNPGNLEETGTSQENHSSSPQGLEKLGG